MTQGFRRNGAYIALAIGIGGMIFNAVQMIIIIAGEYNRNQTIESPLLQLLDSIALTALWFILSALLFLVAMTILRRR